MGERVEVEFRSHGGRGRRRASVIPVAPFDLFPGENGSPPPLDVLLARLGERLDVGLVLLGHVNATEYTTVALHDRAGLGFRKGTVIPIHETYCQEEIIADRPFVLGDAELEERYATHPGFTKYGLRSYVGVPIYLDDGTLFGTVCGVDARSRRIPLDGVEEAIRVARALGREISGRLGLPPPRPRPPAA